MCILQINKVLLHYNKEYVSAGGDHDLYSVKCRS